MKKTFLLLISILVFNIIGIEQSFGQQSNIIFVTSSGNGNQDGSSWTNAKDKNSLPQILNTSNGSEVWIAAGTYKPTSGSRENTFNITSDIAIYGGFIGNETSVSQRDWESNKTIFSGDIGIQNDTSDNCFHVVTFENSKRSILDGVTITKGVATGEYPANSYSSYIGGGILITTNNDTCNPVIRNCKIIENFANSGAGIYMTNFVGRLSPIIDNCYFGNNKVINTSPAILIESGHANTYPVIKNCLFEQNGKDTTYLNAIAEGAFGIKFFGQGKIEVKSCVFKNNHEGGLRIQSSGKPTYLAHVVVDSCQFISNNTQNTSSALFIIHYGPNGSSKITNCQFSNHNSNGRQASSTLSLVVYKDQSNSNYSKDTISNCIFFDNDSYSIIRINVANGAIDTALIHNCLFYNLKKNKSVIDNIAADGGVTNTTFSNNTIYATENDVQNGLNGLIVNYAQNSPGAPYGNPSSNMSILNSILCFPFQGYTSPYFGTLKNSIFGGVAQANLITQNSLIQFEISSWPTDAGTNGGNNLINVAPVFWDENNYNFRLGCNSPAVDVGNSSFIPNGLPLIDLDGQPRVYNSAVDMGSYEQQGTPQAIALPIVVGNGMEVEVQAFANMAIDSLKWDFGDGFTSNHNDTTHIYSTEGNKTVCLKIFTNCGVADSCIEIQVLDSNSTDPPNNINGIVASSNIQIFPNPSNGLISINNIPFKCNYEIYSLLGHVFQKGQMQKGLNILDLSGLTEGVYYVQVFEKKKHLSKTMKLILLK